jgi:hypothetical protein
LREGVRRLPRYAGSFDSCEHVISRCKQFQGKSISSVLSRKDGYSFNQAIRSSLHKVSEDADPNSPQDPGKTFIGGGVTVAIQHISDGVAQCRQCPFSWYPVVTNVVSNFVGKRKPLLVVRVGSIHKDKALSGSRHEACAQWTMPEIRAQIYSPIPKPVSQVRKAQAWQLDDREG